MNLCPCCATGDTECRINIRNNVKVLAVVVAMYGAIAFFGYNGYSSIDIITDAAASGISVVTSLAE